MLRISNQLHRHGLRDILNNPDTLIAKLSGADKVRGPELNPVLAPPLPPTSDCGQYLMAF